MRRTLFLLFLLSAALADFGCVKSPAPGAVSEDASVAKVRVAVPEKLRREMTAVEKFFKPMGEPGAMDWLAYYDEDGQTFEEYLNGAPTLPANERKTIYIQPLGDFTDSQEKVLSQAADYIAAFYNLPVATLPRKSFDEPLSLKNYRINESSHKKQIRTGYILDEILLPNLPGDAAALIAFTAEDLYPNETMNFVFGQASLQQRVGVWSLNRLKEGGADDERFLYRTLKIAVHETGHMFSIAHCTKYQCVMSGSNGTFETDPRPVDACPECMAKIAWGMNYEPAARYRTLAEFCRRNNLTREARLFEDKFLAVASAK